MIAPRMLSDLRQVVTDPDRREHIVHVTRAELRALVDTIDEQSKTIVRLEAQLAEARKGFAP